MVNNVSYGAQGYAMHEDDFFMENEYQSKSMQMMPPQYSEAHHASFGNGSHGSYSDNWQGNGFQNGYYRQGTSPNGFPRTNAFKIHASGGKVPGMHYHEYGHGPVPNNMMMNSEYETYHAGAGGRKKFQNCGMHFDSQDDFPTGMHRGHHQVEYKNL